MGSRKRKRVKGGLGKPFQPKRAFGVRECRRPGALVEGGVEQGRTAYTRVLDNSEGLWTQVEISSSI